MKLKKSFIGLALALQFFTAFPIRKQFDMNVRSVTWMFGWLPFIGLIMGSILVGVAQIFTTVAPISALFLSILLVVGTIVLTGGIHLDGWVDLSDAYFSYGEREKRLEILDDPRTGAFGAISLVCLLLVKVGVIYEALQHGGFVLIPYFICIPMLARMAILLYFLMTNTSKEKGLAAYFKKTVEPRLLAGLLAVYITGLFGFAILLQLPGVAVCFVIMALVVGVYRYWTKKNFGGMSGDLLGALCEGMEVVLWMTVLFFI